MDICPITGLPCLYKKCIYVTEISNNQATESAEMCVLCGSDFLAKNGGPESSPAASHMYEALTKLIKGCPSCKHTLNDILATGKVGCGNCYTYYKQDLLPILEKCQGATKHVGKAPKKLKSVETLELELKAAIKEENYEKAAIIKSEINKLNH